MLSTLNIMIIMLVLLAVTVGIFYMSKQSENPFNYLKDRPPPS